jgi:hypothetical protein
MFRKALVWSGIVLMLMATACNRQNSETGKTETQTPAQTPAATSAPASVKSGTVVETMEAGGYTYMLVDDGTSQNWLAILKSPVTVGQEVSYYDGMVMENFESKTLGRTFDKIIFSNGLANQQTGGADSFADAVGNEPNAMEGIAADVPTGSSKAVVPFAELKVEKAAGENAYTVEELFAKTTDLNGKTVSVRGRIMKISPGIMGRNWLHIQDGTGNPDSSTHDLVVTTAAAPEQKVGDVATINGVLSANKDFGSGYSYAAIIEEAVISE